MNNPHAKKLLELPDGCEHGYNDEIQWTPVSSLRSSAAPRLVVPVALQHRLLCEAHSESHVKASGGEGSMLAKAVH